MLRQSSSRMKKVLAILLAVLFVVSFTAVAASTRYGGYGHRRLIWFGSRMELWYCTGCVCVNGNWICPSYVGMPHTMQASAAAALAPSPNVAGLTIFPETSSTSTNSSSH